MFIRILYKRLIIYNTTKNYRLENAAINTTTKIETISILDSIYN